MMTVAFNGIALLKWELNYAHSTNCNFGYDMAPTVGYFPLLLKRSGLIAFKFGKKSYIIGGFVLERFRCAAL